jgi:hypothetical protein
MYVHQAILGNEERYRYLCGRNRFHGLRHRHLENADGIASTVSTAGTALHNMAINHLTIRIPWPKHSSKGHLIRRLFTPFNAVSYPTICPPQPHCNKAVPTRQCNMWPLSEIETRSKFEIETQSKFVFTFRCNTANPSLNKCDGVPLRLFKPIPLLS